MMWCSQLSQYSTAHANTDKWSCEGTKRNHFLPQCVSKQWSLTDQRGIEWFWKDLCFTMAVIDNVICHGLSDCVYVCLCVL